MNLEKLDQAIAYIEAHPEEHDQAAWLERWDCGTVACLAGHVALLASGTPSCSGWVLMDGEERHVEDVAREVLDLTEEQADRFFYSTNLAAIKRLRDEMAATQCGEAAREAPSKDLDLRGES